MFNQINIETQIVSKYKFNQQFYKLYNLFIIKVLYKVLDNKKVSLIIIKRNNKTYINVVSQKWLSFEIQCIVKMYLHPQIWSPDKMSLNKMLTVVPTDFRVDYIQVPMPMHTLTIMISGIYTILVSRLIIILTIIKRLY